MKEREGSKNKKEKEEEKEEENEWLKIKSKILKFFFFRDKFSESRGEKINWQRICQRIDNWTQRFKEIKNGERRISFSFLEGLKKEEKTQKKKKITKRKNREEIQEIFEKEEIEEFITMTRITRKPNEIMRHEIRRTKDRTKQEERKKRKERQRKSITSAWHPLRPSSFQTSFSAN